MKTATSTSLDPSPAAVRHHVLVVEDDFATADSLASLLAGAGYRPTICPTGSAALRSANRDSARAAIIDVHLPDMNGLVLAQMLRQQLGAHVPIIVLSGDTSMETLNTLRHVGAALFLSKPLNPQVLLNRLAECIATCDRI